MIVRRRGFLVPLKTEKLSETRDMVHFAPRTLQSTAILYFVPCRVSPSASINVVDILYHAPKYTGLFSFPLGAEMGLFGLLIVSFIFKN